MSTRSGGILSIVPEGYYTRGIAAKMVGRDKDSLRTWHNNGTYTATQFVMAGSLKVWLYNDDDIAAMKEIAATMRPGRKPKPKPEPETGNE